MNGQKLMKNFTKIQIKYLFREIKRKDFYRNKIQNNKHFKA